MTDSDHRYHLRLALSYREKAKAQLAALEKERGAGGLDPVRYSTLLEYYSQHVVDAETAVNRLSAPDRKRLADLQEQLGALQQEQFSLRQAAAKGRLHPHEANEENRRLAAKADALRRTIVELRHIGDGDRAALGDFIDRPLDQYARELGSGTARTPTPRPRKPPRPQPAPSGKRPAFGIPPAFLAVAAGLGVALVGAVLLFAVFDGAPSLALDIAGEPGAERLQVSIVNSGKQPAIIYVPGPSEGAEAFAVVVLVREADRVGFSPVSGIEPAWEEGGLPMTGRNPVEISPGLTTRFSLDLNTLAQVIATSDRLRLEIRGPGGEVHSKKEWPLTPLP